MLFSNGVVSLLLSHAPEEHIGVCVGRADAQQFFERLLRVVKPLELGVEHRQAKICLGLTRGECDGFPEINDSFSKFAALGVNLSELNMDERISRIQALRFTESGLGGAKFAP